MAASPQLVSNNPQFLNARTGIYTAEELRKPTDYDGIGPGACSIDSFRVRQRVAGPQQNVDVTAASVYNSAWVRGSTAFSTGPTAPFDQGMYFVDYNSATILNLDIAAADGTNPRIDQIFLAIEDAQIAGANNQATLRVVTGTPTGGATLDNRTGVGAVPAGMCSILLADILVPALSTSVVTANIRDRRPFGVQGVYPNAQAGLDIAPLTPATGLIVEHDVQISQALNDNNQSAILCYLPRRIIGATKIRWKYTQGAVAAATTYSIGIYDASTRLIIGASAQAFTGTANLLVVPTTTITATTFEAGYYWVLFGVAAMTATSLVNFPGCRIRQQGSSSGPQVPFPGVALRLQTGGTTLPPNLGSIMTDPYGATGTLEATPVPVIALSVA
jgi:hypothetical protein